MTKIYQIVLSILLIFIPEVFTIENINIQPETSFLIDDDGYVRLYHGVNVVYKEYPYYPPYKGEFNPLNSFNEEDMQNLVDWGFNVVRLYMSWEGTAIEQQKYNATYMGEVQNIVSMLDDKGISVFLDAHQDLYSPYFCGEGVPDWVVNKVIPQKEQNFPEPFNVDIQKDQNGYPLIDDCFKKPFWEYYATKDVAQFSEDLLTNVKGLTDDLGQFWLEVATAFMDNDNLLGYEIINEPQSIDYYKNPVDQLLPGVANQDYLIPFYEKVNSYIRQVDTKALVFFQPIMLDILGTGFQTAVDGQTWAQKEILSYHLYCPFANLQTGEVISQPACNLWDGNYLKKRSQNAINIKVGGFLSEFGALSGSKKSAKEIDNILSKTDKHFNSWTYWQYKYFDDITTQAQNPGIEGFWDADGELQVNKVKALSRSYAYKTCGQPSKMSWDGNKETFKVTVTINRQQCKEINETEIYLSEYFFYKNGFVADFKNCQQCKLQKIDKPGNARGYYKISGENKLNDQSVYSLIVKPQ